MRDFQYNADLFAHSGVIGRVDFLLNNLKLYGLMLLSFSPVVLGYMVGGTPLAFVGFGVTFLCLIPLFYFSCVNAFKRLRDIRGTTEKEALYRAILCLLWLVPYLGFVLKIALTCWKGAKVSDHHPHTEGRSEERDSTKLAS